MARHNNTSASTELTTHDSGTEQVPSLDVSELDLDCGALHTLWNFPTRAQGPKLMLQFIGVG